MAADVIWNNIGNMHDIAIRKKVVQGSKLRL